MWSVAPHWFLSGRRGKKLWKCVNVWIGLQLTHSLQSPRVNTNCKLIKLCARTCTHTHTHTHTRPCFPYPSIQTHVGGLKSQRLRWWKWWWEMITHTSMRPPTNYTHTHTHTCTHSHTLARTHTHTHVLATSTVTDGLVAFLITHPQRQERERKG